MPAESAPRSALLAGATGLIGRELLPLLLQGGRYAHGPRAAAPRRARPAARPQARRAPGRFQRPARAAGGRRRVSSRSARRSRSPARRPPFARSTSTPSSPPRARRVRRARAAWPSSRRSAPMRNRPSSTTASRARCRPRSRSSATSRCVIAQPSLLVGDREALGQPARPGEVWATRLLRPVMRPGAGERAPDRSAHRGAGAAARHARGDARRAACCSSARLQELGRGRD